MKKIHDTIKIIIFHENSQKKELIRLQCRGQDSILIERTINEMKQISQLLIDFQRPSMKCQTCDKIIETQQPKAKKSKRRLAAIKKERQKLYQHAWLCVLCQENMIHFECFKKLKDEEYKDKEYRITSKDQQTWICDRCKDEVKETNLYQIKNFNEYNQFTNIRKIMYVRYLINSFFVKIEIKK